MYLEDFDEFKETLEAFHDTLKKGVASDKEYAGEADELLGSLERVQTKVKSMEDLEQLKSAIGGFGWDFLQVYMALDDIMSFDEEDFDFDDAETEENSQV
jgi:hypothetical protein